MSERRSRVLGGIKARRLRLAPVIALLVSCSAAPSDRTTTTTAMPRTTSETTSPITTSTDSPGTTSRGSERGSDVAALVDARLDQMSLEEKVGQIIVSHVYGSGAGVSPEQEQANRDLFGVATPAELVARYHLGGVILIGRNTLDSAHSRLSTGNVDDTESVPDLINRIQQAARDASTPPLLILTDQEQGKIERLGAPITSYPGPMALAATRDTSLARRSAATLGVELAQLGVNVNLAPDADVNVEPDNPVIGVRSFGDAPTLVAAMVGEQVDGYQLDAGIAATVKHFPGHGDTTVDSHTGLPEVEHDEAAVRSVDLPPFAAAIDRGVDLVMTGHLLVPAVDDKPATLSARWVTDILRGELGFDGVVITDSLWMAAITSVSSSPQDAALQAIDAGVDLLLMPPQMPAVFEALIAAVQDGTLSEQRIDRSVRRVLTLKARLGLLDSAWVPAGGLPDAGMLQDAAGVAAQIATNSVTLVAADCSVPFPPKSVLVIGEDAPAGDAAAALSAQGVEANWEPGSWDDSPAQIQELASRAGRTVVALFNDVRTSSKQKAILDALAGSGTPVVAVATGLPYDLALFAEFAGAIAVYDDSTESMNGLAEAVASGTFAGALPVRVPAATGDDTAYPFGYSFACR